jgi:2-methylcitrate dehydratase PrpD
MTPMPKSAAARLIASAAAAAPGLRPAAARLQHSLTAAAERRSAENGAFVVALRTFADRGGVNGHCRTIGGSGRYAARDAAFFNAAMMASDAPLHVAALVGVVGALGQEAGAATEDTVDAVAFGLAVFEPLERAAADGIRRRGHPADAILAAPAAAAAAGRLLKLSDAQLVDALGISGSLASGSLEWDRPTSDLLAGWIARSAVLAARLAQSGFSGPPEVFEGQKGLFAAYAEPSSYDVEALGSTA